MSIATTARGWQASLILAFQRRAARTFLEHCAHQGPLQVQRPFYPEGDAVCHIALLHPPGGVVGGDELHIQAQLAPGAQALLTTPAAGKFYRSAGPVARQIQQLSVDAGATLEWLPQESIIYAGARLDTLTRIELHGDARCIAWEIVCLGRPAAGETFTSGQYRQGFELWREGEPLYLEHGRYAGGDAVLTAPWGLQSQPVTATLLATGVPADRVTELRTAVTGATAATEQCTVTRLDGVLLCRYLGPSANRARQLFTLAWSLLRPVVLNRPPCPSRFWMT